MFLGEPTMLLIAAREKLTHCMEPALACTRLSFSLNVSVHHGANYTLVGAARFTVDKHGAPIVPFKVIMPSSYIPRINHPPWLADVTLQATFSPPSRSNDQSASERHETYSDARHFEGCLGKQTHYKERHTGQGQPTSTDPKPYLKTSPDPPQTYPKPEKTYLKPTPNLPFAPQPAPEPKGSQASPSASPPRLRQKRPPACRDTKRCKAT